MRARLATTATLALALVVSLAAARQAGAAAMSDGCTTDTDCVGGGSMKCLQIVPGIKICTMPCTPDDPATPLINEDTCGFVTHICSRDSKSAAYHHCLKLCTPSLTANPCPASSKQACYPASEEHATTGQAVCHDAACTKDTDCPVYAAKICTASTDCASVASDAFCDTAAGYCARPGKCTPAGICGPHTLGKSGAKVGDPCKSDLDCPGAGFCLPDDAKAPRNKGLAWSNGYCAVEGCAFAASLPAFACPGGSACYRLTYGGRCLKSCSLATASDCRSHAQDRGGDYDCYAWDMLSFGSVMIASGPVCQNAAEVPCSFFASTTISCSALGGSTNTTNMSCRDRLKGTVLTNPKDPTGVCLDDTASGPYGPKPDLGVPDQGSADAGADTGGSGVDAVADDTGPQPDTAAQTDGGAPPKEGDDDGCSYEVRGAHTARPIPLLSLALLGLLLLRRRS